MSEIRDMPQAEFEVMEVLWKMGEATVKQVRKALSKDKKLAYTTVATLLNRLRERGYVDAEERNFAYVFRPIIEREQVVRRKLDDLVQKVLGGDVAPLAAYIAENRSLTSEQLAALEEIVKSGSEKEGGDERRS
jgi:BlaI family transcriptional regulator, penicillinase repressor